MSEEKQPDNEIATTLNPTSEVCLRSRHKYDIVRRFEYNSTKQFKLRARNGPLLHVPAIMLCYNYVEEKIFFILNRHDGRGLIRTNEQFGFEKYNV